LLIRSSAGGFYGFYKELFLTYVLLFGGDGKNASVGLTKIGLPQEFVDELRESYSRESQILALQTFKIYGTRLRTIQDVLEKWRPQSIGQLMVRPYHEPLSYYGFWAVIVFGCIGLLGLGISVIQAVGSLKGTNVTVLLHANGNLTASGGPLR